MGEEVGFGNPNPTAAAGKHRPRTPIASRLQSPTSHPRPQPFHLGSNDDQLERAQARAARAASFRRVSAAPSPSSILPRRDLLDRDQIMDLFHNCIKLASENKINQKNTWDLTLIDHLSEIVKTRSKDDDETNFQKMEEMTEYFFMIKASCTLEAGVKIYSMRVDSVHSEAYKVLGGINRAGREDDKENIPGNGHIETEQVEGLVKKEVEKKMSPFSTLESSFEALNVKKFDVAFTVDPLYHQTSAQFDEGGAKGLLLNNLGVYGGCRVLFDSFEVPEKNIFYEAQNGLSELADLSFVKEYIGQMMTYMPVKSEISPTLRDIVNQFDKDSCRPSYVFSVIEKQAVQDDAGYNNHSELDGNAFDDCGPCSFDQDDHASVVDDSFTSTYTNFASHSEENSGYTFQDPDIDEKLEKITGFLSLGLGFTSQSNAWAGPDHWKYRKAKGLEQVPVTSSNSVLAAKKVKNQKVVSDIDFTRSLDKEMPTIFCPPKNPKSLVLPTNKLPCNITLPEDCHYRPDSLVRLFILPNVLCLGKKGRKFSADSRQQNDTSIPLASWDTDMNNDQFDDVNVSSDVEDPDTLVCQPRQVNKVDIQYDKVSKQVDVHALKDMLWSRIQESVQMSDVGCEATVTLRQVLRRFRSDRPMAPLEDISPHLYFICLLHLANEHCLSIRDRPSLDDLDIHVPAAAIVK